MDPKATPVVHPPRKVPAPMRDTIKDELERLPKEHIIAAVTEPTEWVSSIAAVKKKNGSLRICLDPRDLNKVILRSHYPMPTLEDVATRLDKARVFTVLDAKTGFWQINLEERSNFLTTFKTAFGRYCWLRMPFGISSAPEVWQRRIHEIVEGLPRDETKLKRGHLTTAVIGRLLGLNSLQLYLPSLKTEMWRPQTVKESSRTSTSLSGGLM